MHESIVPKIYHPEGLDEKIVVEDGEAFEMSGYLAQRKKAYCRHVERGGGRGRP